LRQTPNKRLKTWRVTFCFSHKLEIILSNNEVSS
jgi:hypothetical protein